MFNLTELSFQYSYVYIAINLFCALISLLFISKFSFRVGNNREIRLFHGMTVSYLIYLVLEIIWVLAVTDVLPMSKLAAGLIKIADTMFIPFVVFFWFWFAEERFRSKIVKSRTLRIIFTLPLVLMCILYFTSFFTGLVFRITPDLSVEPGPLIILTGIVDNIYGLSVIIHAVILYSREKSRFRRRDYWTQIAFIGICTIAGIMDAITRMTPIMTLAIAFSLAYLFVNLMEPHVYHAYSDALTGLNNRRHAERYLSEKMEETSPENPFYLFMADVDRFKEINDTMGHMEGDHALKTVGEAIASAANEFRGFAARWGGDEFIVMIRHAKEDEFPSHFAAVLEEKINHYADRHSIPYPLAMSIGHSICDSSAEKVAKFIDAADHMLYQKKKERLGGFEG